MEIYHILFRSLRSHCDFLGRSLGGVKLNETMKVLMNLTNPYGKVLFVQFNSNEFANIDFKNRMASNQPVRDAFYIKLDDSLYLDKTFCFVTIHYQARLS